MNFSHIKFGFSFVAPDPEGGAYVVGRIAASRFAVIQVSAVDLIDLWTTTEECIPRLDSARILVARRSRAECVAALETLLAGIKHESSN